MLRPCPTLVLWALAVLCFCASHLALLPPWEGMDEHAHYGYAQYLADEARLPPPGRLAFSKDITGYLAAGPVPYSLSRPGPVHPGNPALWTYDAIFADKPIGEIKALVARPPLAPRRFEPAPGFDNWQAQHPPLYYALSAPVYHLTRGWSWRDQLLIMRAVSLAFALAAAGVALMSLAYIRPERRAFAAAGVILWPVVVPMWIPEMARLGNDGLTALWIALAWLLTTRIVIAGDRRSDYLALGAVLGLGLLTKAFFVPVTLGVILFLTVRHIYRRRSGIVTPRSGLVMTMAGAALIGGWWYVRTHVLAADMVGGTFAHARAAGVSWRDLIENFALWPWLRGVAGIATTFTWSGTWSFVRPPGPFHWALVLAPTVLGLLYLKILVRRPIDHPFWLPAFMILPFFGGLIYHGLVWIALYGGQPYTNGWYLHIFFAPAAVVFGWIVHHTWHHRALRWLIRAAVLYGVLFLAATTVLHGLLFAGRAPPDASNRFSVSVPRSDPIAYVIETWERLATLARPDLALGSLLLALSFFAAGAVLQSRRSNRTAARPL